MVCLKVEYNKTYSKVQKSFYWLALKRDIHRYVQECLQCQQVKVEQHKMPSKMQPLDIPFRKWESISMGFITKIPIARGEYDTYKSIIMIRSVLSMNFILEKWYF